MGKLSLSNTMSLDGYVAGPDQSEENPLGIGGMELHEWFFPLKAFREMHGEEGGEVNASSGVVEDRRANIGATIMGRNMFGPVHDPWPDESWRGWWGEDPPYHDPVFVLTHHPREPLEMQAGTTFHFVSGPERLIIGRFCAIAAGVRFLLPGANHADRGPSTFPFGTFGSPWDSTMDLVLSAPSRGDTVVGNDVWFGYEALVLPGVKIGHGAVIAAASVVASDVPPYAVVAGNPARVVRRRFDSVDVDRLLRAAWWDWPAATITTHARTIMAGTPAELERIARQIGRLAD